MVSNLILQAPPLGVVVYLVIHFLGYLKTSREDERLFVTDLVKDQSATIERGSTVIERNTETIHQNTRVMAETQYVITQHIAKCPIANKECEETH